MDFSIADFGDEEFEDNPVDYKHKTKQPWIEKYRPSNIDNLILSTSTLNKIKKIIKEKDMPNIIITGPPGIGKTTTVLCIAKNLLGKYFDQGVLELNASDERGIKVVHESIEYFCKKKLDTDNTCSKHKIVLLDEADNITKKAQQLINNLLKDYNNTTRFAFTCNNSSDIIESIQSRCIIFRYRRLTAKEVHERLEYICKMEKINYTDEGINSIVIISQGDLRKAINNLQITYNGYTDIVPENVYKLCDEPHPVIIQNIFKECKNKKIREALKYIDALNKRGYSKSDIIGSMVNSLKIIDTSIVDEKTKIKFMEEIAKACLIIGKGISTDLQLTGCIAALCRI